MKGDCARSQADRGLVEPSVTEVEPATEHAGMQPATAPSSEPPQSERLRGSRRDVYSSELLENDATINYTGNIIYFGRDTGNLSARIENAAGGVFIVDGEGDLDRKSVV